MNKFYNQKGITLMALIITIIVLFIIASISIIEGIKMAEEARTETVETDMLAIKAKLKQFIENVEAKNWTITNATERQEADQEEYTKKYKLSLLDNDDIEDKVWYESGYDYYRITSEALKLMSLDEITPDLYIISIPVKENENDNRTEDIIDINGVNVEKSVCYRLSEIQNDSGDGKYVTYGLLLRYDGILNTRTGNIPNATSWEDLSGNNNDGVFHSINTNSSSITDTDKGYYSSSEKGYVFLHNDAYIESTNNIGLSGDDNYTVEVVMKPWSDGKNTNYSEYSSSCPVTLGARTGTVQDVGKVASFSYGRKTNKINFSFVNNTVFTDNTFDLIDKVTSFSISKIKTNQISTNDTDVAKITVNGISQSNKYTGESMTLNLQNSKVQLGRNWQHNNENRTFYGSIQSIRIYNRVLTDGEVQRNYLIDKDRFGIK